MNDHIEVKIRLSADTPSTMDFRDVGAGLKDPWYHFAAESDGGVTLWANRDGYEWLARVFLKLARSEKVDGYHSHHTLEFGPGPPQGEPELTIGVVHKPTRGARAV
jgi:hypothetical protein